MKINKTKGIIKTLHSYQILTDIGGGQNFLFFQSGQSRWGRALGIERLLPFLRLKHPLPVNSHDLKMLQKVDLYFFEVYYYQLDRILSEHVMHLKLNFLP